MIVQPKIVPKAWGEEIWIHNDEEYCGKLLRFHKAGSRFSMHYHIIKKESWYVGKGSFEYIWGFFIRSEYLVRLLFAFLGRFFPLRHDRFKEVLFVAVHFFHVHP